MPACRLAPRQKLFRNVRLRSGDGTLAAPHLSSPRKALPRQPWRTLLPLSVAAGGAACSRAHRTAISPGRLSAVAKPPLTDRSRHAKPSPMVQRSAQHETSSCAPQNCAASSQAQKVHQIQVPAHSDRLGARRRVQLAAGGRSRGSDRPCCCRPGWQDIEPPSPHFAVVGVLMRRKCPQPSLDRLAGWRVDVFYSSSRAESSLPAAPRHHRRTTGAAGCRRPRHRQPGCPPSGLSKRALAASIAPRMSSTKPHACLAITAARTLPCECSARARHVSSTRPTLPRPWISDRSNSRSSRPARRQDHR